VTFHGFITDEARDKILAESDVLVCPSMCEGFGYPVAEAMARGIHVLTSDIAVFGEYVPDECRFPLDEPAGLATRIDALTSRSMARLRSTLVDSVARFSPAAHAEQHRVFFTKLLGMD
jgi:glycosyltransferase involved in cell wall biosynthesis